MIQPPTSHADRHRAVVLIYLIGAVIALALLATALSHDDQPAHDNNVPSIVTTIGGP